MTQEGNGWWWAYGEANPYIPDTTFCAPTPDDVVPMMANSQPR